MKPLKLNEVLTDIQKSREAEVKKLLIKQALTDGELADALDCSPAAVRKLIAELRANKVRILYSGNRYSISSFSQPGGHVKIPNEAGRIKLGFTTDNHIGNRHFRKDVLQSAYDDFERRGVKVAFNAGNMLEGESRFNKQELVAWGLSNQVQMAANEFPSKPGLTTYFVTGDDHEGWYAQREKINIGEYMQEQFLKAGREDLKYVGHVETDIEFNFKGKKVAARLMHPGGGSAYAYSYTSQKIVEAFQGGEKPGLVLGGHYHKYDHCYPREVHFVQGGCTCDQTIFMRKNKIAAHVGYVNLELEQDRSDGHITELLVGWKPSYDRGYYERRFD